MHKGIQRFGQSKRSLFLGGSYYKTFTASILCFLLLLLFSVSCIAQASRRYTLVNPTDIVRPDELVILKRADLEKHLGAKSHFVRIILNGKEQPVQFDDIDSDGKWDEAVMLYTFQPKEKVAVKLIKGRTASSVKSIQRANVRLRKKNADDSWGPNITSEEMLPKNLPTDFNKQPLPLYLTEGPAWENDKVGFRLYFDIRNGKDIWGKLTSRMVLDSVGTLPAPSYHELQDWGMDILKVGKSLGAGSLALLVPMDVKKDTLIRLGGENIERTVYQQLSDGPLRATFQITYDWMINGKPVQVKELVSIWGGQYFYESKVWIKGAPKGSKLVTGIVSLYDNVFQSYELGGSNVLFSYGKQSENRDFLGMAVLVPAQAFSFVGSAPNAATDIVNTYMAAQEINEKRPCVFRFVAGWEKSDERFSNLKTFKAYVDAEAKKMGRAISKQF